jgi:hypothetical protein
MTPAVSIIATIPIKLKGAKEERFFIRQSGSRTTAVRPKRVWERVKPKPRALTKPANVSARTILYANKANIVFAVQENAGIQEVEEPRVFSHALLYEDAPVIAQIRPIKEKL